MHTVTGNSTSGTYCKMGHMYTRSVYLTGSDDDRHNKLIATGVHLAARLETGTVRTAAIAAAGAGVEAGAAVYMGAWAVCSAVRAHLPVRDAL